ncbi:MAG TPA: carboxypeptidase regulatory-like domain-containing protein [Thermoanaerobaculia bacterium]|nr:carboxypeptidase regulatory-like domain-containing protein [Thermoanaerobaculia bacterium]
MSKHLSALAGLAASLVFAAGPVFAGDVTGTITYTGKVPNLKPIAMNADPVCASKHSTPAPSEVLVLGPANAMANVMVRVKGPVAGSFPVPAQPAVIDQRGCQYHPHVLGLRVGQTLQLRNSDGLLHNVHALPKVNTPFNMAMPANRTTADTKFPKEEGMFLVKCDVHPWMNAYVGVFTNPFFSVSAKDGKYKISGLPPGTYEIEAWHEKLGVQTAKVTVAANKPGTANFSFAPPAK